MYIQGNAFVRVVYVSIKYASGSRFEYMHLYGRNWQQNSTQCVIIYVFYTIMQTSEKGW